MGVMKRSFGLILSLSVISLIVLIVAVFFLTRGNETTFKSSGYIISFEKGTTVVDKFSAGTEYRENLNGDLVFENEENKRVEASLDNFIHYDNGDIAYLKNGVILDLSKVNETIIPYYNITNKSLIETNDNEYLIKTINGEINLTNWIGRISDEKYIISGENLTLKVAGSADIIYSNGSFFEFTYIENGVVVISDGTTTRSTVAEDSYFYVGENTVISLGDKNVYFNNEAKLSLSQMTINGDENIDIVPPKEEEEPSPDEGEDGNSGSDNDGTGETGDDGIGGSGDGAGEDGSSGDSSDGTGGTGTDGSGDDKDEPQVTVTKNPTFKLIEADVTANKMNLLIQVIDTFKVITGDLNISVTNMKTARTVYTDTVPGDSTSIAVSTAMGVLEPDTNYIVSIVGNYQSEELTYERQYFQRVFRTETLGIKLVKDFASTDSLSYLVTMDEKTYVKDFDLELYDKENNKLETRSIEVNDRKEIDIMFEGLTSNTEYTGVLRNIRYDDVTYSDITEEGEYREDGDYTLALSIKTLKKAPIVKDLTALVSESADSVKLTIGSIEDPDKGITNFIYTVYEYSDVTGIGGTDPVTELSTKDAKSIDLPIDGNELKTNQTYRFNVVVEYYDNEKYVEYETGYSASFVSGAAPAIKYVINEEETNFRTLVGTFYIEDKNCTVPLEGRECYNVVNNTYIRYYKAGTATVTYYTVDAKFEPVKMNYEFSASDLEANTEYVVEVFGDVDLKDGKGIQKDVQIGESIVIKTDEIVPLTVEWGEEKISNEENVFSLGGNILKSTGESDIEAIHLMNIKFNLYASNTGTMDDAILIHEVNKTSNLKEQYYDNNFKITATDTYGLNIEQLKDKTDGLLTKYYIFEITDLTDNAGINNVPIENNTYVFEIDKSLIADDILGDPEIAVDIKNVNNAASSAIVTAKYDYNNLKLLYPDAAIKLVMGVCNTKLADCYDLPSVDITESAGIYSQSFDIGAGTDYYTEDLILDENGNISLKRGNSYKFRFYIMVDFDKDGSVDYYYPGRTDVSYVESSSVVIDKKVPTVNLRILSSTANSITYSYYFSDGDKTLYKEAEDEKYNIYYVIGDNEYKVPIEMFQESQFTIEGLSNNTRYDIYYETALNKDETEENDVKTEFYGKYTFDGFYDGANYDLKYTVVNNEISNKIVVKILNSNDVASLTARVSAYQVLIKYNNDILYNKYFTDFKECTDDSCFLYKDIKYSSIEDYNNRDLRVEVNAIYDNGLIGNTSDIGYLVQQNSNELGQGSYLVLDEGRNLVEVTGMPGVYYYEKGANTTNFDLYNLIFAGDLVDKTHPNILKKMNISAINTNEGVKHGNFTINFKSLARVSAVAEGNTNFIFYSITPDVETTYEPIINGADITIDTTGITKKMLEKGFVVEDGKYYIYLELYNEDGTDIETLKQEVILNGNEAEKTYFNLYNLDDATTYKYKLFAKLIKDQGEEYTGLNDIGTCDEGNCEPVEYSFTTLNGSNLFGGMTYAHSSSSTEEVYVNRIINFDLTLNNDLVNFGKNYDLLINLYEGDNVIGTTTVTNDKILNNANVKFDFDITNSKDAIYGAEYFRIELIAISDTTVEDENIEIYNEFITLEELKAPLLSAIKRANTSKDGDDYIYTVELDVGITDTDKVIDNGVYTVKLFDDNDEEVAVVENLSVDEIRTIVFATKVDTPDKYNVQVALVPNRKYNIEISYSTYMNNITLRKEAEVNGRPFEEYTRKINAFNLEVYTTGKSGVSLGDVSLTPTASSLVMSFFNSSNLEKVTHMDFTISKSSEPDVVIASGEYDIGEEKDKTLVSVDDGVKGQYYNFIVNPEGLTFEPNIGYIVAFRYYVTNEDGAFEPVTTSNNIQTIIRVE